MDFLKFILLLCIFLVQYFKELKKSSFLHYTFLHLLFL